MDSKKETIILECIDGKDDHFHLEIASDSTISLGNGAGNVFIRELEFVSGTLLVSNSDGNLIIDASQVAIPVKINGTLVSKDVLKNNDLLRIGNSVWKPVYAMALPESNLIAHTHFDKIREKFTSIIGLEELKDFRLPHIFSSVFSGHTIVEMEDQLVTGTSNNTPAITEIEVSWARPWLFSRLILLALILTVLLISDYRIFQKDNL